MSMAEGARRTLRQKPSRPRSAQASAETGAGPILNYPVKCSLMLFLRISQTHHAFAEVGGSFPRRRTPPPVILGVVLGQGDARCSCCFPFALSGQLRHSPSS
jgi:hypothetical protein